MDALNARARRLLALLLLCGAAALAWFTVISPVAAYYQNVSLAREADLRTLGRNRALLALAPSISAALNDANHSPRWARFYDSPKPEQAVLQLETDLRELLKFPNNPTSMIAQPADTQGALTRVRVKVTLSMPIDQFVQTLARLTSHSKQLEIESLTIQAPDYQVVDSNPPLAIQAEIAGFMLSPKARI